MRDGGGNECNAYNSVVKVSFFVSLDTNYYG